MGKRGRPRKYDQPMTEQLNIALTPTVKNLADAAGSLDYWREMLQSLALLKNKVDAGQITPEEYGALAAAETMRISGFVDDDYPDDEQASEYWKSLTQRTQDQAGDDET